MMFRKPIFYENSDLDDDISQQVIDRRVWYHLSGCYKSHIYQWLMSKNDHLMVAVLDMGSHV